MNFFTSNYTRVTSDHKGRQHLFSCSRGTRHMHTTALPDNCPLGANLAFPWTSRYKKADLEMATIVWLFCTFFAPLYQFIADVYISSSPAKRLARATAVWNLCLHSAGFFYMLKSVKLVNSPTITHWPPHLRNSRHRFLNPLPLAFFLSSTHHLFFFFFFLSSSCSSFF